MTDFGTIKEKELSLKDSFSTQFKVRALDQYQNSVLIPAELFKQASYLGKAYVDTIPNSPIAGEWYYAGELGTGVEYPQLGVVANYGAKIIYSGLIWEVVNELDMQAILDALNANISGLTYSSYRTYIEVGFTLEPSLFTWSVTGSHPSVNFTDSEGIIPTTAVTGQTSLDVAGYLYMFNSHKTVTWRVISSTGKQSSISTTWVVPSYFGKNSTGLTPTITEVLLGTKLLKNTNSTMDFSVNTTATEYSWFALPHDQTAKLYESWYVNALNQGTIQADGFIRYDSTMDINGTEFDIYIYNYSSELNDTIKLT